MMVLECKDHVDTFFLARGAIMGLRWHMECPTIAMDGQRRQLKSSQVRFLFFRSLFFLFVERALFTVISLLYILTTVTKCQIAGDLPSALFDVLKLGWSLE